MNTQVRLARYQLTHVTDWLEGLDESTANAEEQARVEDLLGDGWAPFEETRHDETARTADPIVWRQTDNEACAGTETQTHTQRQKESRHGHD